MRIGIWERNEGLQEVILEGLRAAGAEPPVLEAGAHPADFSGELDLLVISPEAVGWAGAGQIHAGTVLLSGAAGPLARVLRTERAVSYGTSARDTLTLSSLEGDQICVALQRELVTVTGRVLERQELVLPFPTGRDPLPWLAVTGTLLLLDVPPAELWRG